MACWVQNLILSLASYSQYWEGVYGHGNGGLWKVQNMIAWRCMVLGSENTGFGVAEIPIK